MTAFFRGSGPRDPQEPHRSATPLELFTDLCSVVAVAQAALSLHHAISEDHVAEGVLFFALAFFGVWWAWLNFAWHNSAYDSDDTWHRVLTVFQIVGSVVLAAGIPQFFEQDLTLAVAGYVIMRVGLTLMWLRAGAGHPERRATALRYAGGLVLAQLLWVVVALVPPGSGLLVAFVAAALVDVAVPLVAERAGATPWHAHHIAERYGLFYIIVLGETVLSATLAVQIAIDDGGLEPGLLLAMVGGLLVIVSSWWLYFSRPAAEVLQDKETAFGWGFGHYLLFGAQAAVGAGLAARVNFYDHHSAVPGGVSAASFTVPVALLLAVMWLMVVRPHDAGPRTGVPFGLAVVLVLLSTLASAPELMTGVLMVALLVVELRLTGVTARPAPRRRRLAPTQGTFQDP